MKQKSIVYINFAPYDNAGRILDFITGNFGVVIHFSYDHLRLKNGRRSKLAIYEKGKLVYKKDLIWLRTHPLLLFPSLPVVAFLILLQTFFIIQKAEKKYGPFDVYLTVNAFTACIGILLKKIGLVKKTIFWVWDYFPPKFPDWRIRVARYVYWKLDKPGIVHSDKIVFLNKNLERVRKEQGITAHIVYPIIPIGTNPQKNGKKTKTYILGHMGMLKLGQGLDLLFDNFDAIVNMFPKIKVEIIGSGPHEDHFRKKAKKYAKYVTFYGFVENDDTVDAIIQNWSIGLATYVPDESSEHYFTDPSKIKAYLNQRVPVITTAVPEFAQEVKKYKAGIIVNYYQPKEFLKAIKTIIAKQKTFSKNAGTLAKKYQYKKLYKKLFA